MMQDNKTSFVNEKIYNHLDSKYDLKNIENEIETKSNKDVRLIDVQELSDKKYRVVYSVDDLHYFVIDIDDNSEEVTIHKTNKRELMSDKYQKETVINAILKGISKRKKINSYPKDFLNKLKINDSTTSWKKKTYSEKYEELTSAIRSWLDGPLDFLVISGPGGTGKSTAVRHVLKEYGIDKAASISADTPRKLFDTLKKYKDETVITFDDVDSIFRDKSSKDMLKHAMDSDKPRIMTWVAGGKFEDFEMNAKIVFITNKSAEEFVKDPDMKALQSRFKLFSYNLYAEDFKELWTRMAHQDNDPKFKTIYKFIDLKHRLMLVDALFINYDNFSFVSARLYLNVLYETWSQIYNDMFVFLMQNRHVLATILYELLPNKTMTLNEIYNIIKDMSIEDIKEQIIFKKDDMGKRIMDQEKIMDVMGKHSHLFPRVEDSKMVNYMYKALKSQVSR